MINAEIAMIVVYVKLLNVYVMIVSVLLGQQGRLE